MLSFQPFLQDLQSPGWKEIAMWIYWNPRMQSWWQNLNDNGNLGRGVESNFPSFDPFGGNDSFRQNSTDYPFDQPPSISRREYPLTKSAHAPAARISPRIDSGLKVCFPWVSGNSHVKSVDLRDPNLIKDDHRVLTHQRINLTSAIWEQENFVMNPTVCKHYIHGIHLNSDFKGPDIPAEACHLSCTFMKERGSSHMLKSGCWLDIFLPCAYWTKRIIINTLLSISQQKTIYDATSPPQGFRLRIRRKDNHDKDDNDSLSRSSSSHCRQEKSLKSKVNNPQTHSRLQSVRYTPQSLTAHPWKNHGWENDPFPSG